MKKQNQRGITLIALIITIIVMLILVGVTITVALNGGLFSKAEEATTKTKIAQIQEALTLKRTEVLADYKGKAPADFGITIDKLNLPAELETEYENKLIISTDGKLYYDASVVTNEAEQNEFKEMGIQEYVETNTGELVNEYTFTIADLVNRGLLGTSGFVQTTADEFFPEYVSEELKNGTITKEYGNGEILSYNITCSNSEYSNAFDMEESSEPPNAYVIGFENGNLVFYVTDASGNPITSENYTNYPDLSFTISMPE